jgi:hypothetical protein
MVDDAERDDSELPRAPPPSSAPDGEGNGERSARPLDKRNEFRPPMYWLPPWRARLDAVMEDDEPPPLGPFSRQPEWKVYRPELRTRRTC